LISVKLVRAKSVPCKGAGTRLFFRFFETGTQAVCPRFAGPILPNFAPPQSDPLFRSEN